MLVTILGVCVSVTLFCIAIKMMHKGFNILFPIIQQTESEREMILTQIAAKHGN